MAVWGDALIFLEGRGNPGVIFRWYWFIENYSSNPSSVTLGCCALCAQNRDWNNVNREVI